MQELQDKQLQTAIEATRAAKEQLATALAEWPPRYSQLQQQFEALLNERDEIQAKVDQLVREGETQAEMKLKADELLEKSHAQLEASGPIRVPIGFPKGKGSLEE